MRCGVCGSDNPDGVRFCGSCGNVLDDPNQYHDFSANNMVQQEPPAVVAGPAMMT